MPDRQHQGGSAASHQSTESKSPLEQLREGREEGAAPVVPASRRSRLVKNVLHWTRRGHLYAGLLLCPWVFLYGITGFLFNHPEVWPDQPSIAITSRTIQGTELAKLQRPAAMAAEIVAAINGRGGVQYALVEPEKIQFGRAGLTAVLAGKEGTSHNVSLNANGTGSIRRQTESVGPGGPGGGRNEGGGRGPQPNGSSGGLSGEQPQGARGGRQRGGPGADRPEGRPGPGGEARAAEEPTAPFAVSGGLFLKTSPLDLVQLGLPAVLSRLKLTDVEVREVRMNPLNFVIEAEGKKWQVTYNPLNGSVVGRDASTASGSEGPAMTFRRFLLRLHMAHGYPTEDTSMRFVWAIIVDAMAFVMVFWGISGIVMWWQIKRTRVLGGICLFVSVSAAIYVGIGMHELIMAAGR